MSKLANDPGYRAGWCIHYQLPHVAFGKPERETCEAGVRYDSFEQPHLKTQPCFLTETGESKPDALPCSKLRRPTTEEIALHEEWHEQRMNVMRTVMVGIKPWRDAHKGCSAQEVIECPACKGRLHLSISSYSGHVHGRCETENCASWME